MLVTWLITYRPFVGFCSNTLSVYVVMLTIEPNILFPFASSLGTPPKCSDSEKYVLNCES